MGFAPRGAPEIVVVALFEHGEHGQFAAPIVRDVLKAYFDKKVRVAALQQQQAGVGGEDGRRWQPGGSGRLPAAYGGHQPGLTELTWPAIFPFAISTGLLLIIVLMMCARRRSADLQRHHGHRIPQRLVEADPVRGRRAVLMWLVLAVDYHTLLHYVPMLYIGSVLALLGTYVVGRLRSSARRRWIPLPGRVCTCRYRNSSSW